MKRIFVSIILILLISCAEIGLAHSGFKYGKEKFEDFVPSLDGTAYPEGLFAQNFDKTVGGAGIYSSNGWDGKCIVIKTTATRGYTQLAYRYTTPTSETTCFSFDISINDSKVERSVQIRFGETSQTIINVLRFETDGDVMLGNGYISGFELECGKIYHVELTVNPVSGKVSAIIEDDCDIYKSQGNLGKTGSIYSFWITNNGKAMAETFTDNWYIKSVIEPLDIEYYDNFNFYDKSILSGVTGYNAGEWSMPAGSGKVTYEEGVLSDGSKSLKMTTVSTTNAQNLEYVSRNSDYTNTIGYDFSIRFEDFNTEKRIIVRDSSRNTLELGRIDKTGVLYWGRKSTFYKLKPDEWYKIKITYNMLSGYSEVEIFDTDSSKSYWDITETRSNIRYAGIANMAYSAVENHGVKSVIYIDDFTLYEKNPVAVPIEDKTNINNMDSISGVNTTGTKTYVNNESTLKLSEGEYLKIPYGDKVTFTTEFFRKSPGEIDLKIGEDLLLKITGENIYYGDDIIGKISVWNWYKICVTIDNDRKYITLSDDGKLIGSITNSADKKGDISVVCKKGEVYLDNFGIYESGKNISYVYTNPGNTERKNTSFFEMVFPNFIDKERFKVYLNGEVANVRFVGDKTVRIENLETDSYYYVFVDDARDLYGNYLNAEIEFETGHDNIDVQFDKNMLNDEEVNVEVVVK